MNSHLRYNSSHPVVLPLVYAMCCDYKYEVYIHVNCNKYTHTQRLTTIYMLVNKPPPKCQKIHFKKSYHPKASYDNRQKYISNYHQSTLWYFISHQFLPFIRYHIYQRTLWYLYLCCVMCVKQVC